MVASSLFNISPFLIRNPCRPVQSYFLSPWDVFLMNIFFFKEPQSRSDRLSINSGFLRTMMGELMGSTKSRSSITLGTDSNYSARRLPLLGTLFKRGKLGSCQSIASHKSSKLFPPIFGAKKKAASSGKVYFENFITPIK